GQVIGQSSEKAEVPKSTPITPQDLMATVFHVLGIPLDQHFMDTAGRPAPMIDGGEGVAELGEPQEREAWLLADCRWSARSRFASFFDFSSDDPISSVYELPLRGTIIDFRKPPTAHGWRIRFE